MSTARPLPSADHGARWVARAIALSYFTIAYNLLEGLVSIFFGLADDSVALFGFGADSLIEVTSAVLVLWRFRGERRLAAIPNAERERRATMGIAALFLVLAAVTIVGAGHRLWARSVPESTLPGVIISGLSLSFMFLLWSAKLRVATALDSATVKGDAACSLACIKLSVVLLAGSGLYWLAPSLWWADAVAAVVIAAFIAREGREMMTAAKSPTFTGGCGCSCGH